MCFHENMQRKPADFFHYIVKFWKHDCVRNEKAHVVIVLCTKVKKGNEVSISSVFETRGYVKLCLLRWASSQYKNLKPEF